MNWCRCSKCGHKLFLYDTRKESENLHINIKCSSCKSILDVVISDCEAEVKIDESKT